MCMLTISDPQQWSKTLNYPECFYPYYKSVFYIEKINKFKSRSVNITLRPSTNCLV